MPVNPAAALAIQVAKGILSMGWAFWSVDHVKQSHSGGPPPLTIKMSWPGVVNCQPECSQSGAIWDGLEPLARFVALGGDDRRDGERDGRRLDDRGDLLIGIDHARHEASP